MKAVHLITLVALSPVLPSPASDKPAPPAAAPPEIEQISDNEYRLSDITFFKDTRTITFPARVNQDQDALEYIIVHEDGKTHESLLKTAISPYHLQVVLLLCGYQPHLGNLFSETSAASADAPPASSKILVSVAWETREGAKSAGIEEWVLDRSTGKPMARGSWSYTGSAIVDRKLQAEIEGSILAIYLDELALLNYPGPRNDDDDNWTPLMGEMPSVDHPVRVTFKPAPVPAR